MNWFNLIIISITTAISSLFGIHNTPPANIYIASSTPVSINQSTPTSLPIATTTKQTPIIPSSSSVLLGEPTIVKPAPMDTSYSGPFVPQPVILIPLHKFSGTLVNPLNIKWDSSIFDTNATIIIYILKNGKFFEKITEGGQNNGLYSWSVDESLPNGDYQIEITTLQDLIN